MVHRGRSRSVGGIVYPLNQGQVISTGSGGIFLELVTAAHQQNEQARAFAEIRHFFAVMAHARDQHLSASRIERGTGSNPVKRVC